MKNRIVECRRGASLIECCAIVLVLSMIGMTMGPSLKQVRSQMRGAASTANLQHIGQGASLYGFFDDGRLFSYTWRAGEVYLMPDGRYREDSSDQAASASQNEEILERRTGRINGISKIRRFSTRIPQRRFNHLVLLDFLNEPLETTRYIDPADTRQLFWHANPLEYLEDETSLPYVDGLPDEDGYDTDSNWRLTEMLQRWTFASSYQSVPSSWQPEYPDVRYTPVDNTPHLFRLWPSIASEVDLHTGRRIHEVVFPSQKVWIFEEFDREQAGNPYFGYDHARAEKLMFDGSVNSWASGDANASIVPERGLQPWRQKYVPLHRFPIPLGGLGDQTLLSQRFRWTFGGLSGVDYGPVGMMSKESRVSFEEW